ncbi:MAG TPA: hypothetical protein VFJ02_14150, partial [Vicinamibacterales bacterium]|nr:hypothetical protein [Vicinamibacterales bacterium]
MLLALAILMRPSLHRVEPAKIAGAPESQVSISTPAAGASSPSTATQRRSPPPSVRPLRTTGPSAAPADRPVHAASLPVTEAADPVSDAGGNERREEGSGESGEDVMHVEMAGLPDQLAVAAIAQPASAISAIVIAPIAITDIAVAPIPAGGR